jgi:Domain of unknown function (DUF3846)
MKTHKQTKKNGAQYIEVMVFEPGKPGELRTIPDSLLAKQELVGGYIEVVMLAPGLACICNEEGGLEGLPVNRWGFVGTFFLEHVRYGGRSASLSEKDKRTIASLVRDNTSLIGIGLSK